MGGLFYIPIAIQTLLLVEGVSQAHSLPVTGHSPDTLSYRSYEVCLNIFDGFQL
jgi:hypothetical protein